MLGDYLVATGNPLATPMELRHAGHALTLEREALATALPAAGGRLAVLVHGLCMNDLQWQRAGHDHGAHLAQALGYTPVYLRYNTGQHTSTNGQALAERLEALLQDWPVPVQELSVLAHSMGGLVVRACIYQRRPVMDALMARDGARLLMLGTPHQGAHSMVENLLGKGDTLRTLVRLDVTHDMQEVLDIISGFRGALQLLPKPGFVDIFQGQSDGGAFFDYQQAPTWLAMKASTTRRSMKFWSWRTLPCQLSAESAAIAPGSSAISSGPRRWSWWYEQPPAMICTRVVRFMGIE